MGVHHSHPCRWWPRQGIKGFVFPGEVSLTGGRREISGGKYQSWELKIKDEHKGYPRRRFQIPTWRNDPIWTSIFSDYS